MAYLRRSKDAAAAAAGGGSQCKPGCKKHPKHRQSPGVCSLCLTEKLNKISSTSCRRSNKILNLESSSCSSSSSLSSGYSSCSASSCSSPVYRYDRYASIRGNRTSLLLNGGRVANSHGLTRSRTTTGANFAPKKTGVKEGGDNNGRKNKESGFLSRLWRRPRRKEEEGLMVVMHSSGTLRVH